MVKTILFTVAIMFMTILSPTAAHSQDEGDPVPPPPDPRDVPFDGGLSLLVAAGVGYGLKKVRDSRKEKKATNTSDL